MLISCNSDTFDLITMPNFGYSTIKFEIIDLDKSNLCLAKSVQLEEPSFNLCISCGSCTATCSVGKFNGFSFRDMCHSIRLGQLNKAMTESEKCLLCGKCTLVCPRNVNTRNILRIVRRISQNIEI
jgi:heterodisulfide reductase subunit C